MESPAPPTRPPDIHMTLYQQQQVLFDIEQPTNNDVLCGRGVTTNRHVGNENFRSLVNCNKELYVTSTKKQKMRISRSIVDAVRSLDPPGRFLEKEQSTGKWFDIGDKKAVEKTSQALRDGAASLRKQLSEDLGDPDFLSAVFDAEAAKAVATSSTSEANKKTPVEKKRPPVKGHRRVKSNPTALTAVKAKVIIKKHKLDVPMSPTQRAQLQSFMTHRPPLSPMSPRAGLPMSPHSMAHPVSPRGMHPGVHAGHRRGHSMPSVPYPMPGSPIYRDRYRNGSPGSAKHSYDYGPEHYEYGPQSSRPYGLPLSPSGPPHHSPSSHQNGYHHLPHPFHSNSPGGYGRPQTHSQYQPPASPRWSPHHSINRGGPSLSPHPYLHPNDFHHARSPEVRPPLGFSPRMPYPRGGSSQFGSSSSLSVPSLGAERTHSHPLSMSPMRYPPPSPRSCHRQSPSMSPYTPSSPIRREFSPPIQQSHWRSPVGSRNRMKSPVEDENEYGPESEYGPEDEEMKDREVISTKGNGYEVKNMMSISCPSAIKSSSPAAVADVAASREIIKEERMMSPLANGSHRERGHDYRDHDHDDYPSDEDPHPTTEDMRVSPLPFDQHDDPSSFMDLPDNLLSLPISPCGPNDCEM